MYIGLLNDRIACGDIAVFKRDSRIAPALTADGNPFQGETLSVSWKELLDGGVDMVIRCPEGVYLSAMTIRLGGDDAPAWMDKAGSVTRIAAYTAGKQQLLSEYRAETGRTITEKLIPLTLDVQTGEIVIEVSVNFSDVTIDQIDLYGAELSGIQIFPTPDKIREQPGSLPVAALTGWQSVGEAGKFAAQLIGEKAGIALTECTTGNLRFASDAAVPENGYRLSVCKNGVDIAASDRRGFVMGAETLVKLIDGDKIPCCEIEDAPAVPFRGAHLYLPSVQQMPYARNLVKHLLSPMGYNAVIIEIGGVMEFKSHPEINAGWKNAVEKQRAGVWPALPHGDLADGSIVPQAEVAAFCDYIRSFGIDAIPEIQSLGHVQYLTIAHPELAERVGEMEEVTDDRAADIPPDAFYPHCYCPSSEAAYRVMFELIEEILAVVKPQRYVHMGHDEVYQIGVCPVCREKDPAQLYAQDVQRYYDYLKARGLQMMIWADMLQPDSGYRTVPAIDLLPRDILMLDFIWYFHPGKDIEDNLLKKGYPVVMGNMYSSHYPRFEARRRKEGMRGAQISAWVSTSERAMAKEGKLYDMLYSSEMMWSDGYRGELRVIYDRSVREYIHALRPLLTGRTYPSMQPGSRTKTLYEAAITLPPVDFEPEFSLEMDEKCGSLIFEHAASRHLTRIPWIELDEIGWYEIGYEDGTVGCVPIEYGGNICHWARRYGQPLPHMYYRHTGYVGTWFADGVQERLPDGQIDTFYRYEWINPQPDKAIRRITLRRNREFPTGVMVRKIEANSVCV